MSFLLDTNICSAFLKGNRKVSNQLLLHTGGIHISTVVLAELLTWTLRSNSPPARQAGLNELMKDLVVLDVTTDVATKFGEVQAALYDKGIPMPQMDLLIAATALVHNFTLVTHNVSDFKNVPDLRVIDWLVP